jgi:hypothetical protein
VRRYSMIPKSGYRFSDKNMLTENGESPIRFVGSGAN